LAVFTAFASRRSFIIASQRRLSLASFRGDFALKLDR
jgi:hypothetical protein